MVFGRLLLGMYKLSLIPPEEKSSLELFDLYKTNATCEYQETRTPFDQDFCSANLIKSSDILDFSPSKELKSELYKMIDWAEKTL